ncbi:MAG: hypothetical protein H0U67_01990 [Gemmatimonadetes bacterium]|nr:hypothetical protein [Gemmatimonadota bacterium]
MARHVLIIGAVAFIHYLGTFFLLLLLGGAAMHSLDTGAGPSLFVRVWFPALYVLQPALLLPYGSFPGWDKAEWVAGSLLWAVVIYGLFHLLRGRRSRRGT